MSTIAQTLKALKPQPTPVKDIPSKLVITVSESEGQKRAKFVGFLDLAKTVQVNVYLPADMSFPAKGLELVVGQLDAGSQSFNLDQTEERTRKGSAKLVWGDVTDSDSFAAVAYVPPAADIATITAKL